MHGGWGGLKGRGETWTFSVSRWWIPEHHMSRHSHPPPRTPAVHCRENTTLLHITLSHLVSTKTHVRILLIEFSSVSNTILPKQLIEKLFLLGVDAGMWIFFGRETVGDYNEHRYTTRLCTEPLIVHSALCSAVLWPRNTFISIQVRLVLGEICLNAFVSLSLSKHLTY